MHLARLAALNRIVIRMQPCVIPSFVITGKLLYDFSFIFFRSTVTKKRLFESYIKTSHKKMYFLTRHGEN